MIYPILSLYKQGGIGLVVAILSRTALNYGLGRLIRSGRLND